MPDLDSLNESYRERARLIAALAFLWTSEIVPDKEDRNYSIIYMETEFGQISWHLNNLDLDLFPHVPRGDTYVWDRHSTEEKYERLRFAAEESGFRSNPRSMTF